MAVYLPIISEFKDDGLKKANKAFKDLETRGQKVQYAFKKALVPALGVLTALGGASVKLIEAGERASTANSRIRQIAQSMNLFGKETDIVTDRLIDLANKTARQTGLDQNAIKETQAKLLTFKELAKTAGTLGGTFDRATQAAIDLAAAGFGEATTNAVQLGKALNDPIKGITALTRSGVTFTEAEKEKIKALVESNNILAAQELILTAIETQVGGTATATANSTDKMKVAFSQMSESIGMALLPVFEKLVPYLERFADWAAKNPETVIAIATALGVLAAAIVAVNVAMAMNPFVLLATGLALFFITMKVYEKQIMDFFSKLEKKIKDLLGPLGFLTDVFGVGTRVIKNIPGFGGLLGFVPGLADGGIVKAKPGGTLALIGEGGQDEAVVPLRNGQAALSTGGSTINVTVNGALDPVAVARQIEQLLANKQSAFGF